MKDAGEVDTAFGQAVKSELSQSVGAHAGDEADGGSHRGHIVGEDGGGAAECRLKACGKELALHGKFTGQSVEDEVEVDLARKGDCEARLVGTGRKGAN